MDEEAQAHTCRHSLRATAASPGAKFEPLGSSPTSRHLTRLTWREGLLSGIKGISFSCKRSGNVHTDHGNMGTQAGFHSLPWRSSHTPLWAPAGLQWPRQHLQRPLGFPRPQTTACISFREHLYHCAFFIAIAQETQSNALMVQLSSVL